jgi:hypothetical protein
MAKKPFKNSKKYAPVRIANEKDCLQKLKEKNQASVEAASRWIQENALFLKEPDLLAMACIPRLSDTKLSNIVSFALNSLLDAHTSEGPHKKISPAVIIEFSKKLPAMLSTDASIKKGAKVINSAHVSSQNILPLLPENDQEPVLSKLLEVIPTHMKLTGTANAAHVSLQSAAPLAGMEKINKLFPSIKKLILKHLQDPELKT